MLSGGRCGNARIFRSVSLISKTLSCARAVCQTKEVDVLKVVLRARHCVMSRLSFFEKKAGGVLLISRY